ncbi:hypothetical protein D6D06_01358 [Aureobasidium pullulans]|nr:hypothetical protein D6D06_01358 [Aureobasidium pullulans]THX89269.1 hypothetical protein D6D05_01394 [Aureobasidium pullulans]
MIATPIVKHFLNTTRSRTSTLLIRTFIPSIVTTMPPKDKYTDPELRDEVKEEIHQGDKGGAPGQWSARKAQMMASEYKKRGGGYTTDKKNQDESQEHLSKWGEEEWQTKDGSANAKNEDGTQQRYLPKKAWENMSEQEKKETDDKKQAESKEGKQHVENTDKAKESRKQANDEEDESYAKKKAEEKKGDGEEEEAQAGDKRTRSSKSASPSKKQKQNDGAAKDTSSPSKSKSDAKKDDSKDTKSPSKDQQSTSDSKSKDPPGKPASTDRLPEKDQEVYWKTLGNWTKGTVVEVAYSEKEVDGKKVKASEEDPRIVLKSDSSGKIAVHKPDAVYFE